MIEVTLKLKDDTLNTTSATPTIIQEVNLTNKNNEGVDCLNLLNPRLMKDTKSSSKEKK